MGTEQQTREQMNAIGAGSKSMQETSDGTGRGSGRLRKIAILVHPTRDVTPALDALRAWSSRHDVEVMRLASNPQENDPAIVGGCDLIVAIGGDGTTLAALHASIDTGTPVFPIACGSLGILTLASVEHLAAALDEIDRGEARGRTIPKLEVACDSFERAALNDLVLVRAASGQVMLSVKIDGADYAAIAGDGIVVSTAGGSAAYTLASGGPLLHPDLDALVITPLAAHGGNIPPVVLGSETEVTLELVPGHDRVRLEIDGQPQPPPSAVTVIRLVPAAASFMIPSVAAKFPSLLRARRLLADSPRVGIGVESQRG
ncbi:MAG: NAD(+)/NADH kinase [Solirubrobacterales bacterium]|nr:NAD(+)/NADH kinase [Solirubrobacterales bacterium]